MPDLLKLRFETESHFGYLPFLTRIFSALRLPEPNALTQILVEAFNNAVVHGHKKKRRLWIGIDIAAGRKACRIRVADRGKGPKSRKLRAAKKWQTRGRGMALIETLATRTRHLRQKGWHVFEAVRSYK